jgi:murein DD-endopeptidase MepM/ murein hydrolase activator NlpD
MAGYNDKLNPKIDSPFAFRVEQESFLSSRMQYQYIKNGSFESFKPDYLDSAMVFKAIALRVESFATGFEGGTPDEGEGIEGLNYIRVRARVPELHAHIPDPCAGTGANADRATIEMHPLFISLEPTSQNEVPRPGDIIRVSFEKGPKGGAQAGGVYHGIFKRVVVPPESSAVCGTLRDSFAGARRVQQLQDLPEAAEDSDALGTMSPEAQERALQTSWETRSQVQDIVTHSPVRRTASRVTSEWGPRDAPCTDPPGAEPPQACNRYGSSFHPGIDIGAVPWGTKPPVYAVFSGKVTQVGTENVKGNWIEIQYPASGSAQYKARYAHLDSFAEGITAGAEVEGGDHLGMMGETGAGTGIHLHFEFYDLTQSPPSDKSSTSNPRAYLPLDSFN